VRVRATVWATHTHNETTPPRAFIITCAVHTYLGALVDLLDQAQDVLLGVLAVGGLAHDQQVLVGSLSVRDVHGHLQCAAHEQTTHISAQLAHCVVC
jgi:hypothetical protein